MRYVPAFRSTPRRRALCVLGGLALLAPGTAVLATRAHASAPVTVLPAADLTGFTLKATAPGMEVTYVDTSATLQNPADVTVPFARSTFETGPLATAGASLFWPGDTGGNYGSVLQQLSQVPQPIKDATKGQSDPIVAEASGPGDPAQEDVSFPAAQDPKNPTAGNMHAVAKETGSTADASTSAFNGNVAVSAGSIASHADTTTPDGKAVANARVTVTNLNLASTVTIDSITSEAHATSDGVNDGTGSGNTIVSGVKVLGQPATIDSTGLHLGSQSQPLSPIVNQTLSAALKAIGFKASVSNETKHVDGTAVSYESSGVTFTFGQAGSSQSFTVNIGRSFAAADASQIPDDLLNPPVTDTPVTDAPVVTSPSGGGGSDGGGSTVTSGSDASGGGSSTPVGTGGDVTPVTTAGDSGTGSTGTGDGTLIASGGPAGGKPLNPGIIILGLIGTGLMFAGLKRLPGDVLAEQVAGPACPNDKSGA